MKAYVVEMYDNLFEDPALYPHVYLTCEAAKKRAVRMTYEDEGVRHWAEVREVEFIGKELQVENERLEAENERLRKKLEFERENNASIRRLFDAVAPRCGKPDCPSLVEYVEQLRELARDMWGWLLMPTVGGATLHDLQGRMRDLGIEVDK